MKSIIPVILEYSALFWKCRIVCIGPFREEISILTIQRKEKIR
ncbi:hypothetical protein CHCC14819_0371 [Bacillus licheniformis]|nr:hypothetical protein CHCC14819_0371 [Bacillus licheniformis]